MSGTTDPLGDMLTRIRNAALARHGTTALPHSNLRLAVARILKEEGFVQNAEVVQGKGHPALKITLRYDEKKVPMIRGIERVSKPGRRVYVAKAEIPRVRGGLGITVLSTSQGVMTGTQARAKGIGGEVVCRVW